MRIAIPVLRQRISPVFDVSSCIHVLEIQEGIVVRERQLVMVGDRPEILVRALVDVLICAGISRELREQIRGRGIEVIPGRCGGIDEVVRAYQAGELQGPDFAMPGAGQ